MTDLRKDRIALLVVITVFIVSRLLYSSDALALATPSLRGDPLARAAASLRGEHLDVSTLVRGMPILDESLLRHDLWRSLLFLHSQPPLFNLLVAGMLRLPGSLAINYQILNWTLGLVLYLLAFLLMRAVGAGRWAALAMTAAFMLNPNAMWMEGAIYYGVVMAVLLSTAAWAFWRALATESSRWFALCVVLLALIPLTRAFFAVPWFLLMAAFVTWSYRSSTSRTRLPRGAVVALVLALALVLGFQVKQRVMFGQWVGSSWLGCNLATMTAGMSREKQIALERGDVSPLVQVYRNAAVPAYEPFFDVPPTGIPALDEPWKSGGIEPNFNHQIYIPVGRQYLEDTLYLIVRNPLKYLLNVVNSLYIFSGYQIGLYFDHPDRFFARWTWIEIVAPLIGFPLIVLALGTGLTRIRRAGERGERLLATFMMANIVYVILVSVLLEKSEGPVYRYQIDAFLYAFLAFAVTDLGRRARARRRRAFDDGVGGEQPDVRS